ncbi:MAG: DNA primase [Myxococcota bacterium]|nr:DNA primase [Myxococcota bacterium]
MGRIPESTIQEVIDRADILGLIGRYVDLKQTGQSWKGLCPFHDEKTASFNVNPGRHAFYCFGCQAKGNVIGFLMDHENLTFPEALRTLAADLGIEIPESGSGQRSDNEKVFAALDLAQRTYREALRSPAGQQARQYLEERGLDPGTIDRFGIGYAPDAWDTMAHALGKAGFSQEVGMLSGLLNERSSGGHYDRLRDRVIFPIQDVRGRVIAFGGRALGADQQPKYLNTPESPVYHKRRTFYGFPHALEPIRRAGRAIVCEGYFDAIALARAGLAEAVATCGTALTADHARDLGRRTKTLSLLFDGDSPGQKAMEKALEILLPAGLRVRAVSLPAGMDPDDYLVAEGGEALAALVDRAPDALEVVIRRAAARGCSSPAEKADAVGHVAPLLAGVSDPVERSEYVRRLALTMGADRAAVESVVRAAVKGRNAPPNARLAGVHDDRPAISAEVEDSVSEPEDRALRQAALIVSRHPELVSDALAQEMTDALPNCGLKELILAFARAGKQGHVDNQGRVDLEAMAEKVSSDQLPLAYKVIVDEELYPRNHPPGEVLSQLVGKFVKKNLKAEIKRVESRLDDPDEDKAETLEVLRILHARCDAIAASYLDTST